MPNGTGAPFVERREASGEKGISSRIVGGNHRVDTGDATTDRFTPLLGGYKCVSRAECGGGCSVYARRSPRREGGPRMHRSVTVCTGTACDGVSTRVVQVESGAVAGATVGGRTTSRRAHRSHSRRPRDGASVVHSGTSEVCTDSEWQVAADAALDCSTAC
jgi:hypothetical protein